MVKRVMLMMTIMFMMVRTEGVEKIKQTAHPFLQKTKSYKTASRFLRNLVLQMLIVNGWIGHPSFNGSRFSS